MKRVGFAANTLVHAQAGIVPIQSLQTGDLVLTQEDGSSEHVCRPVVKVHGHPDRSFVCIDFRKTAEGLAWLDGMVDNTRGSGLGRTIDLRDGKVRFQYEMVPNGDCDPAESEGTLRQTSFAPEVEGRGAYFAGEWGIRVRSAIE